MSSQFRSKYGLYQPGQLLNQILLRKGKPLNTHKYKSFMELHSILDGEENQKQQLVQGSYLKVLLKRSKRRALLKTVLQFSPSTDPFFCQMIRWASSLVLVKSTDHLCCRDLSRIRTSLFSLVLTAVIKFCTYHQPYYSSTVTGCQPGSALIKKERKIGLRRELQNNQLNRQEVVQECEREARSLGNESSLHRGDTRPAAAAQPRPVPRTLAIQAQVSFLPSVICEPSRL